jgi:hypothetical protein
MDVLYVLNASNGLAYKALCPTDHVSLFLSSQAHHADCYFRAEAMPHSALVRLLCGGVVAVVDASGRKPFPDSLVTGVGSWVLAFNRALRGEGEVPHATPAMRRFAGHSEEADRVVRSVRRLARIYGDRGPATMHFWRPEVPCFRYNCRVVPCSWPDRGPAVVAFAPGRASWDDKPAEVKSLMEGKAWPVA